MKNKIEIGLTKKEFILCKNMNIFLEYKILYVDMSMEPNPTGPMEPNPTSPWYDTV